MAQPAYIQKTLIMKPEVSKIFDDLEAWLDYCRFNLIKYDPKDLYKSKEYREFSKHLTPYKKNNFRKDKKYNA